MSKKASLICCIVLLALLLIWLFAANSVVMRSTHVNTPKKITFVEEDYTKDSVYFSIDGITYVDNGLLETIAIRSWAFVETEKENSGRYISYILKSEDNCYEFKQNAPEMKRPDVVNAFSSLTLSNNMLGFYGDYSFLNVKSGTYDLCIYCWENEENYGIVNTGYQIVKDGTEISYRPWQAEQMKKPLTPTETEPANSALDYAGIEGSEVILSGWAYVENETCSGQSVNIGLESADGDSFMYPASRYERTDVAKAFENKLYTDSGFRLSFPETALSDGTWELTILLECDGRVYSTNPYILTRTGDALSIG